MRNRETKFEDPNSVFIKGVLQKCSPKACKDLTQAIQNKTEFRAEANKEVQNNRQRIKTRNQDIGEPACLEMQPRHAQDFAMNEPGLHGLSKQS